MKKERCVRVAAVFTVLLALSGCVSAPHSSDPSILLNDTTSRDVVRVKETIDVPFETAYRNVLREARICWNRASVLPLIGAAWRVESDIDSLRREGLIYLVATSGGFQAEVTMSIELRAVEATTAIRVAAIKPPHGKAIGSDEINNVPKWARGSKTSCSSPGLIL
jgi:hypothetical protein